MPQPIKRQCWYLQQANIFSDLSSREKAKITKFFSEKHLKRKAIVFSPRDRAEQVYILKKGEITLYRLSRGGKKVIIDVLKPDTLFGNISFTDQETQDNYAEASLESYVCIIPKHIFLGVIKSKPDLILKILELTSQRLREAEERIKDLALADAREKIIRQIVRLLIRDSEIVANGNLQLKTKLTHEKLAHMVGLTRETTTKILNDLAAEGVIVFKNKYLLVKKDLSKLENL